MNCLRPRIRTSSSHAASAPKKATSGGTSAREPRAAPAPAAAKPKPEVGVVMPTVPRHEPGPAPRPSTRRRPARCRRRAVPPAPGSRAGSSAPSRVSRPSARAGRSTSTSFVIRPGRADMTATRVERKTASGIECVTKMTVVPVRDQIRWSSRFMRSRVISSSAPNGSSMRRMAGSSASARAMATRCCIPPESCHGRCPAKSDSSTRRSISRGLGGSLAPASSRDLEWQLDVLLDRPPLEQDRRLEDHPVVAIEPRLARGLAVDRDRSAGRADEVADDPQ